jgi:histidinol-phosphate/aromatic aminotransferase/cobyric acid decarboxylase-like protein
MYASNYSKNLITAEEKVAELMKQRDAAVAERDRLHAEVKRLNAQVALDDKAKLLLVRCNTSDRLRAEKADARIKELENGIEKLYLELRNGKKPINL